ncbi:rhomboid family intramembrane serine protease [Ferruginibacter sp.]
MAYNSGNSYQRITPIVLNLIIINVLVWLAQVVMDKSDSYSFWLTSKIGLFPLDSGEFKPYQLVTYMFAHSSYSITGNVVFFHILFNMYALWMFGTALERVWGPKRFLIFYLACGLAAGITQMFVADSITVGASGAVMGLLAGFAYLFPNTEFFLFPVPFPIKAKFMVGIYAAIDLFGGLHPGKADNVAHYAHLSGLVMGFIIVIIWNKTNKKTFY